MVVMVVGFFSIEDLSKRHFSTDVIVMYKG